MSASDLHHVPCIYMIIKATSPTVSPLGTGFKFIVYMQVYAAKRFLDKKIYTQLFVVVKLRRLEPFSFVYQDLLFNAIPFLNHLNLLEERFKSLNNLLGTSDMPPGKSPFCRRAHSGSKHALASDSQFNIRELCDFLGFQS